MSYADRVDYTTLSPRILRELSSIENTKSTTLKNNVQALLFDEYEAEHKVAWSVVSYLTPEITIDVESSDEVTIARRWFREHGFKSRTDHKGNVLFEDNEYASSRSYRLESVDDSDLLISLRCKFGDGTCQFVDEPTDKFEDIAEIAAVPAHKRQVMKRVLKCGSTEIPSVV
tara:strand:+ start:116 stop:631 length:516 start_codon:yes stop_codon:yes gene_type:complete